MLRSSAPPPRHDHALVDDVARQLGRRLLEHATNGADDLLQRRLERLHDLRARERYGARQAGDQVAAAYFHVQLTLERQRRTDLDLDLFRRAVADHDVVLLAHVVGDRFVEAVAADAHRAADDDAAE